MTIAHGQAIDLPTSHFVGWTRVAGVRLPFPLNTREQEYVDAPVRADLDRFLATDRRDESPALDAVRRAFARPALIVYAVRSETAEPGTPETKYVAVSGRDPESSAMVVLDAEHTRVLAVAEHELAASVASAVPIPGTPSFEPLDSTVEVMSEVEDTCLSDASVRTKRAAMNAAGLPPDFVATREAMLDRPRTAAGIVSAVSYSGVEARPADRSAVWVESSALSYLQASLPPRGSKAEVRITPLTTEHLFRACADSISSCFPSGG